MTNLIWNRLKKLYPKPKHYLNWKTPEQLLVATILSAQCTDERVNKTTPDLFKKYPSPKAFANANIRELENLIKSCGFFRNKAKSIKESNKILVNKFHDQLPKNFKDLLTLPGVARKTANALQQNAFHIVEGIVVDTHVIRLANRFNWSSTINAEKIEKDLFTIIPKKDWNLVPGVLKSHGKSFCKAPIPVCAECPINKICPSSNS